MMGLSVVSAVEQHFFVQSRRNEYTTKVPYIVVPNVPNLGLFTSLRFLEWVAVNPEGVISLPASKAVKSFLTKTQQILSNWDDSKVRDMLEKNGLFLEKKPSTEGLKFVQAGEFYPINPKQHNSFYNYVYSNYINGLNINPANALLINSDEIELAGGKHFSEVFPDSTIDLSLRSRAALNHSEELQQTSIFEIDNWCTRYEQKIRDLGGIGFFLSDIGPDGHIVFNTKGSDLNSTTRLTATNYETQAASATNLGGIEVSQKRLVITIGLGTIAYNPECVSIISTAGEANAQVVKDALENSANNLYPATALQCQKNACFYITEGAAVKLDDSVDAYFREGEWTFEKTTKAIFDLCERIDKYAHKLELSDLQNDKYCSLIPDLSLDTVKDVVEDTKQKMERGLKKEKKQSFLHTGPHHDDIMLGIFPIITQQLRQASNKFHFSVLTSGYNSVNNQIINQLLKNTLNLIAAGEIQMIKYPDFFEEGYKYKRDKDISQFLDKVADKDEAGKMRGVCHRIVRILVGIYNLKSEEELVARIKNDMEVIANSYDGEKNPEGIQLLKGQLREYEEELVWAHYGVPVKNIEHNRLGFYSGKGSSNPEMERDVMPVLDMLRRVKPTVVSLAFDPEGSGPDTHYKVLQTLALAIVEWGKETDISNLRVVGYRNVWFKYQPHEANVFTSVSLNSMATMGSSFRECYISQVNASFPSPELDGPFSDLSQRTWVNQFKRVQLILGKDYFYEHKSLKVRATHGMIFHKEMQVDEFLEFASELGKSVEGVD